MLRSAHFFSKESKQNKKQNSSVRNRGEAQREDKEYIARTHHRLIRRALIDIFRIYADASDIVMRDVAHHIQLLFWFIIILFGLYNGHVCFPDKPHGRRVSFLTLIETCNWFWLENYSWTLVARQTWYQLKWTSAWIPPLPPSLPPLILQNELM